MFCFETTCGQLGGNLFLYGKIMARFWGNMDLDIRFAAIFCLFQISLPSCEFVFYFCALFLQARIA